jgi:hypothetical protein
MYGSRINTYVHIVDAAHEHVTHLGTIPLPQDTLDIVAQDDDCDWVLYDALRGTRVIGVGH